jgi:hypothetical protein
VKVKRPVFSRLALPAGPFLAVFVGLPVAWAAADRVAEEGTSPADPDAEAASREIPALQGARRRLSLVQREPHPSVTPLRARLPSGFRGWRDAGLAPVRGMTIGPIESQLQPGRGYGSVAFDTTLGEVQRLGGGWISLTVFGRVWDKRSAGVELSFEQPAQDVRRAVARSVQMAHRRGLRVLLVPHLWLESGEWRAEMDPGNDARFERWAESYGRFVLSWAEVAEASGVDVFASGVELRSWVTTARAPSFVELLGKIRARYSGLLTYAANWDDAEDTVVWGQLDLIGINAFYPLHWEDNATWQQVEAGGLRVAEQVEALARLHEKPVVFTEFGYTTRKDTEIKPWLWPEELGRVEVNQTSQARAYAALLGAMRVRLFGACTRTSPTCLRRQNGGFRPGGRNPKAC